MTPHRYRSFTEQNLPDNVTDKMIDAAFGSPPDDEEGESEYERRCIHSEDERDRERDERGME